MAKEMMLNVKGMTCQMCVKHVTKALQSVAGVTDVTVSLDTNTAQVTFNPDLTGLPQFKAVVAEAGYEVTN